MAMLEYNSHQVLRIAYNTSEQATQLARLDSIPGLDFWSEATIQLPSSIDVRVPPQALAQVQATLKAIDEETQENLYQTVLRLHPQHALRSCAHAHVRIRTAPLHVYFRC